jgi:GT2 family glycosyltransferase
MGKVAYILVCWNNQALLDECMQSIDNQLYPQKEIYLIDNNSSDGSAQYVEEHYPHVKLIKSDKNNGFARGNNLLIAEALKDHDIEYFALVNTDARLDPGWTTELVKVAKKNSKVATLQGLTLDYFDHAIVDSHHIYVAKNLQATQYGYKQCTDQNDYYTREVQGVNMAAAIVTRSFIEEQPEDNLFDESFFMYLEDVDVALRAEAMGWKNYFVSTATAYHMGSASSSKRSSSFSLYYTARNQPGMLVKNMPLKVLLKASRYFLKNEYQMIRHFNNTLPPQFVRAYIKGRLIGYPRALLYLNKRCILSKQRVINSDFLWTIMQNQGWLN